MTPLQPTKFGSVTMIVSRRLLRSSLVPTSWSCSPMLTLCTRDRHICLGRSASLRFPMAICLRGLKLAVLVMPELAPGEPRVSSRPHGLPPTREPLCLLPKHRGLRRPCAVVTGAPGLCLTQHAEHNKALHRY